MDEHDACVPARIDQRVRVGPGRRSLGPFRRQALGRAGTGDAKLLCRGVVVALADPPGETQEASGRAAAAAWAVVSVPSHLDATFDAEGFHAAIIEVASVIVGERHLRFGDDVGFILSQEVDVIQFGAGMRPDSVLEYGALEAGADSLQRGQVEL